MLSNGPGSVSGKGSPAVATTATIVTASPDAPVPAAAATNQLFWFKEHAEGIIALAGIAYAGGFFTVMIHTYRLGIPVVELVEPIYVWVGLPLAAAFVSLKFLLRSFQRQHQLILQEVSETRSELMTGDKLSDEEWLRRRLERIGAMLGDTLTGRLTRLWIRKAQTEIKRVIEKRPLPPLNADERRHADRWLASMMVPLALVTRYSSLLMYTLLFPFCLFFCVAEIYPWIPQGLGGGKPSMVRLVIAGEKLDALGSVHDLFIFEPVSTGTEQSTKEPAKLTRAVDLLFSTDKGYYIRTRSGELLTLPAETVEGVIWLVATAKLEPQAPGK